MISTTRDTNNIVAVRRVIDIAKNIDVLEPDAAPLTQLMKKISKRECVNPEFKWMEEESLVKNDTVNYSTNYTGGATQFVMDHGTRFRAGDVIKVMATGEQCLVTKVATNTLDVQRGWGTTTAGNVLDGGVILIAGNANEEGDTKRDIMVGDQTPVTNYTQIFRTPFGITRTADNSEMYGGGDLKHQRMMQLIEHQKEMERAFWFGEPKEDLSLSTHPIRATGGVDYFISTGADDASGTLTESEFDTFLMNGFRYGSKTKFLFAAPIVLAAINYWAKGKLLTAPSDKTYGISVMQYVTPFGTVNIVLSNIFSETTTYAGYAYLLDLEGIKYRYLANGDTKLKTNIQDNSADGEEDEYITEAGLQFSLEKKSRLLYGVTSFT